jgi:amino-acid N-acetyltransferase
MTQTIEKARISDATEIHRLINYFADKGEMLPRPLSEIYENIRDYFVIRQGERVVACAALHVNWVDLAEVKSLAVVEDCQQQSFALVDKSELPHKVWGECYRCPKFPDCDESALVYHAERDASP